MCIWIHCKEENPQWNVLSTTMFWIRDKFYTSCPYCSWTPQTPPGLGDRRLHSRSSLGARVEPSKAGRFGSPTKQTRYMLCWWAVSRGSSLDSSHLDQSLTCHLQTSRCTDQTKQLSSHVSLKQGLDFTHTHTCVCVGNECSSVVRLSNMEQNDPTWWIH